MNLARAAGVLLLAAAPLAYAGSPFDGFWMKVNADKSLDPGSQVEYRVDRKFVTMNTPQGAAYKAKADGSDAPMENSPNSTSVSVKLEGRTTLVQTEKSNGRPWLVTTMEIDAAGTTASVSWKNLKTGQSGGYTMSRQ